MTMRRSRVHFWIPLLLALLSVSVTYADDELIPDETDESITCSCEEPHHPFIDGYEVRDDCLDGPDVAIVDPLPPAPIGGTAPAPPRLPVARATTSLSGTRTSQTLRWEVTLTAEGARRYGRFTGVPHELIQGDLSVDGSAIWQTLNMRLSSDGRTIIGEYTFRSIGQVFQASVIQLGLTVPVQSGQNVGLTARKAQSRSKRMLLP